MQTAAWWTVFGTLALATAAGVFAGMAEKQEDDATRLANEFGNDGNQLLYEDHKDEYEEILDRGNRYQWAARGLLIASGVGLAAAITLFAIHAKRSKLEKRRARLGPASLEVSF